MLSRRGFWGRRS